VVMIWPIVHLRSIAGLSSLTGMVINAFIENSVNGLSEGKAFGLVAKDDNLDNSGVIVGS
jgi:hypothetical protein